MYTYLINQSMAACCTRMVYKIVPYAYGTYHTRMHSIKYAYGTEHIYETPFIPKLLS